MGFRPLHDRVVVRRVGSDEKTAGGIIIPDTAQEKPSEGQIVSVGPGGRSEDGKSIAMDVKAGDRVLFGKWSGTEVSIDGEELLIMKESDIMGVIEAPKKKAKKAAKVRTAALSLGAGGGFMSPSALRGPAWTGNGFPKGMTAGEAREREGIMSPGSRANKAVLQEIFGS